MLSGEDRLADPALGSRGKAFVGVRFGILQDFGMSGENPAQGSYLPPIIGTGLTHEQMYAHGKEFAQGQLALER